MEKTDKIYIAGHKGMVGSAILRKLEALGFTNIIMASKNDLDLRKQIEVEKFFNRHKPDYVFLAAAKVGGIKANKSFPVEFLLDNLLIQNNIINQSFINNVKKIIFLGSSCIYPKDCPQPMKEEYLMQGPLEPTNEGYALAKLTGIKLLEYYKTQYNFNSLIAIPCNLYGTNDSFDPENSHVLSALVKKFVDAKEQKLDRVELWGSGAARREFMHVADFVDALFYVLPKWETSEIINIGTGIDISIKELAELICRKVNYTGKIFWDTSMPDGMLKKCMDITKLNQLGFKHSISLEAGIQQTINEYNNLKERITK